MVFVRENVWGGSGEFAEWGNLHNFHHCKQPPEKCSSTFLIKKVDWRGIKINLFDNLVFMTLYWSSRVYLLTVISGNAEKEDKLNITLSRILRGIDIWMYLQGLIMKYYLILLEFLRKFFLICIFICNENSLSFNLPENQFFLIFKVFIYFISSCKLV